MSTTVTEWYDRGGFHRVRTSAPKVEQVTFQRGDVVTRTNAPTPLVVVRVEGQNVWVVLHGTTDMTPTSEWSIRCRAAHLRPTGDRVDLDPTPRLPEPLEAVPHGTRAGYEKHRCRCAECRTANAEHVRRVRANRKARLAASPSPESDPGHGTQGGYDAGCRCEACSLTRRVRHWRTAGAPKRHEWRETVTETYRSAREAWERAFEQETHRTYRPGIIEEERRAERRGGRREVTDFLEAFPPPTLREVMVGLSAARKASSSAA